MVLEIAEFMIVEGGEDGFVDAYRDAVRHVTDTPGCLRATLRRGVESPRRFVLLVEWERLEDHLEIFRGSEAFTAWRAAVGGFFAEPPRVEHFETVS
jgi:quinol monooxygenase YgiN